MEDVTIGEVYEQPEEKDNSEMVAKLLENAKAAIMGAIELHNKPIFFYRYEVSIILTINAWELAMKAYILTYHKDVKIFYGDATKEFLNCLGCINYNLGKDFMQQKESIELLYKYRCDTIHFYGEGIELILYSLLRPNILYFSDFLLKYFKIDLASEANLIILPIGFKRTISPVDFLSKSSVEGSEATKKFMKSIIKSAKSLQENGFSDGLICDYSMNLENINKVKNADIIVGITKDPSSALVAISKNIKAASFTHDANAPKFKIDEESLFKTTFIISSKDFLKMVKEKVPTFKATNVNMKIIIKEIKEDANCFRYKYLDANPTPKSSRKGFYSEVGLQKAVELFTPV